VEQSGNFSNPYRYAEYIYDEEITLYNLKARYYDAGIARFLQEDTYLGDARDPLSLNLYTYCKNEPLKYYDPSGHSVAVRDTFQGMGWRVDYFSQPADWRKIIVTNPNTGQFYGIAAGEYTYVGGSAHITNAFFDKIVATLTPAPQADVTPRPPSNDGGGGGGGNQSGTRTEPEGINQDQALPGTKTHRPRF
jgi:RHS repeat-associated protein